MRCKSVFSTALIALAMSSFASSSARATALQFAGDGDRVNIAVPGLFNNIAGNDFTVTGRVRLDGIIVSRVLFVQKDTSNFATILVSGSGALYFYVASNGTTFSVSEASPLTVGQWSHFAARWTAATNQVSLIVDGVAASTPGGTSSTGTSGVFTLGARSDGGQPLNGALDEITLWPTALSDAQIAADRSGQCVNGSPVLRYTFEVGLPNGNNAGLTTLPDASGNGIVGTLNGFALNGTTSNWVTSPYNGCSSPDAAITLTAAPNPIAAGDAITWTAHVTSTGPGDSANVTVTGEVPAGTTFVSLTPPAGFACTTPAVGASGALSCNIATLPSGTYDFVLNAQSDAGDAPNSVLTANWSVSTLADSNTANNTASASISIRNALNILADAMTTAFNQPVNINVLANDSVAPGGAALDPALLAISAPATYGNASCDSSGCSYTPTAGYTGIDGFAYQVCDQSATPVCGSAAVRIAVAPNALGDRFVALQDTPFAASVAGNDTFPANSSFAKISDGAAGTVAMAADGSFVYTPNAGYFGGDTFIYQLCLPAPDSAVCAIGTVELTVLQPNDRIFYDGFGF